MHRTTAACAALAVVLATALTAAAHDAGVSADGFDAGLLHPFTGWDHGATMIGVGLWAALLGRAAVWLLPATFPMVMALGIAMGASGIPLAGIETGLAVSALVLGTAVLMAARPPLGAAALIIGIFAAFHGHAHGARMLQAGEPLAYGTGFLLSTGALNLVGVGIGLIAGAARGTPAARATGGAVGLAGLGLLAETL